MDKEEAKLAAEGINCVVNLVSRAISAYENCKRLDVEMAELKAKRHIAEKTLDLKKFEIEKSYQQFERKCEKIEKFLAVIDRDRSMYLKNLSRWQKNSDEILSKILELKGDDAQLNRLKNMWEQIESMIANGAMVGIAAIPHVSNTAQTLLANVSSVGVGFSSPWQIDHRKE